MSSPAADPHKLELFLAKQLQNVLNLLSQHQSIGSTHILYPSAIVDDALQTIKKVHDTLLTLSKEAPIPQEKEIIVPK